MNEIIHSALMGAAFLGGASTVVVLVGFFMSNKTTEATKKLHGYWQQSLNYHAAQIDEVERIADALEKLVELSSEDQVTIQPISPEALRASLEQSIQEEAQRAATTQTGNR